MDASYIISKFGGPSKLAKILDYPPTTVTNWQGRNSIPAKHQPVILEAGKKNGIDIKPEHFFKQPPKQTDKHRNGKGAS